MRRGPVGGIKLLSSQPHQKAGIAEPGHGNEKGSDVSIQGGQLKIKRLMF
jgi:hypothetical protein